MFAGCASDERRHEQAPIAASETSPPAPALPSEQPPIVRTAAYESAEGQAANDGSQLPAPLPPKGRSSTQMADAIPAPEELPTPNAAAVVPGAITLSEAMSETLQSDPKLCAAMEGIRQAEGDLTTSSLPPNPSVQVNGDFLPLRTFTPERPGGPPELDVIGSWPIDWYVFGKLRGRDGERANRRCGVQRGL